MSQEGTREAFCPILWRSNGGKIRNGLVVIDRNPVRGVCTRPYDCLQECLLFEQEMRNYPPENTLWVCPTCLEQVYAWARQSQIGIVAPGYFSEGLCEHPSCTRPEFLDDPPRYSRMRQVVIAAVPLEGVRDAANVSGMQRGVPGG